MKVRVDIKNQIMESLPGAVFARASKLLILVLSAALAMSAIAQTNTNDESSTAYVDSIHQWGAWNLDIEPAAGGLQPPSTQPLNARDTKLSLRTNSISALAPVKAPSTINPVSPVPVPPVVPVVPIVPVIPTITPINPNVPIPVGGPNDGF